MLHSLPKEHYGRISSELYALVYQGTCYLDLYRNFKKLGIKPEEISEILRYIESSITKEELSYNVHYSKFLTRIRKECEN